MTKALSVTSDKSYAMQYRNSQERAICYANMQLANSIVCPFFDITPDSGTANSSDTMLSLLKLLSKNQISNRAVSTQHTGVHSVITG